jgi:hypothetical protein
MKNARWLSSTTVIAFALVGSVRAQAPDAASGRSGQVPEGSIAVTGCLKTSDASVATGTSGAGVPTSGSAASAASNSSAAFMLTTPSVASAPTTWARGGASGVGVSGASGTTGSGSSSSGTGAGRSEATSAPSAYLLQGRDADLRQHVNKQVEITGRLAAKDRGAAHGETAGRGSRTSGHTTERIQVDSVRVVAEACSVR